jgi:hypothetical protein
MSRGEADRPPEQATLYSETPMQHQPHGNLGAPPRMTLGGGIAGSLNSACAALASFLLVALSACGDLATASLDAEADTPISVTGAYPAEGVQGETLTVRISGSGFVDGVVATWERDGLADPGITVRRTVFVSSTELDATIAIASDADVAGYDVAVSRDRKKGIGTEGDRGVAANAFMVKPYDPEPLGFLTGLWTGNNPHSVAFSVNVEGVIVGGGRDRAVMWSKGGGIQGFGPSSRNAHGAAINNKGWIVGSGRDPEVAFIYEDGRATFLKPLPGNEAGVHNPTAINNAGTIVGWASPDEFFGPFRPIIWKRNSDGTYGSPERLPAGEHALPNAINTTGDIVGKLGKYAVLWSVSEDGTHAEPMILGGEYASANGINDAGWIVGIANVDGNIGAPVVWRPDYRYQPQPLERTFPGTIGWARSINNRGDVVGTMVLGVDQRHGVLWRVDGGGNVMDRVSLLPGSGYDVSETLGVNDHGWIVGYGTRFGTQTSGSTNQAILWRP